MASAVSPAPDAVAAAGPARVFLKLDSRTAMSSGHLSDGGHSLSRRLRVRRKNSHRDDDSSSDPLSTSGDLSSGQLFVKIPSADARSGSSPKSLGALETGAPPRPPRSPRRQQEPPTLDNTEANPDQQWIPRQRTRSTDSTTRRPVIDDARGRETRSENGQFRRGQRPRGLSLPRHAFRNNSLSDSSEQPSPLTPNAFTDIPPIPVFSQNRRYRHQPRDSGITHQSTASSSLYPKSTSTEGSYPSPPSLPAQDIDDRHIITVDPADNSHFQELHEMDADDVSYRLRLLMQNNYYLPPAHSKPFCEVPSSDTPKKSPLKSSSPTFFDIFKVVKKKSSAASDHKAAAAAFAPMLRTTSDSSTLSGLLRPQQPALPSHQSHAALSPPQARQETKKGRVVVVRERMDDLVSVAKQVEQELKVREAERRRIASETSHSESIQDEFVDPTDCVDLPVVPSNDFFGPQAALLHGMGIDSSVGAALLADQLPPSSSGMWSVDSDDVAWRKAILHAAVGHSLNSSSVETPIRSGSGSSRFQAFDLSSPAPTSTSPSLLAPSVASPASSLPLLPSASTNDAGPSNSADLPVLRTKRILGQRILNLIVDEDELQAEPLPITETPTPIGAESDPKLDDLKEKVQGLYVATEKDYEPIRASSPTVPTTPLLPPPRRPNATPAHSTGSRSDNAKDQGDQADNSPLDGNTGHLQVDQGITLRLSDAYESHIGLSGAFGELTPPGSQHNSATLSAVKPGPEDSSRVSESLSATSGSHYSDDEEDLSTFHTPREHTLASTFAASRPSFASTSILRASCESSQPSPTTSAFRDAFDRSPYAESFATHSVANTLGDNSRASSRVSDHESARYAVVSPPPRVSSSLAHHDLHPPPRPRRANSPLGPYVSVEEDRTFSAEQEEPGTPTGLRVPMLALRGSDVHPNSYPASPISFFDAVEMQSCQEEEEESSESDNEDEGRDEVVNERHNASEVSSSIGGYQSDSAGMVVVDPRTGSTHSVVHDPAQTSVVLMQERNASLPRLGSRPSLVEQSTGLTYESLDRRRAITNVPRSSSRSSVWYKKQGKQREQFPNPPRISESTADRLKHEAAKEAFAGGKRPQTAGSRTEGASLQSWQEEYDQLDPSVRRLDGLLIEHMEREKEVLKRITTTLSKSST